MVTATIMVMDGMDMTLGVVGMDGTDTKTMDGTDTETDVLLMHKSPRPWSGVLYSG